MKRRPDLPLARDASRRFLPWTLGLIVYLGCLGLALVMALDNLSTRWARAQTGALTVQIDPTAPGPLAERVAAALAILHGLPGVASAEALDRAALARLLEPWLGPDPPLDDLPVPALIDVRLGGDNPPDAAALAARLAPVAGATVDDSGRWLAALHRLSRTMSVLAAAGLAALAATGLAAVAFVARGGLQLHRGTIELLHLMGASDAYIAGQFQRHVARLALGGGLAGWLAAETSLAVAGWALSSSETADNLLGLAALGPRQWAALAAVPAMLTLAALPAARIAVLRALARMG